MKGVFISIEGIEGTGKSTQAGLLAEHLQRQGLSVVRTLEPGGTPIGLRIRELLLSLESAGMDPLVELLLYNASRVQHIREVIMPALGRGAVVITDRFSDSTAAYQGFGRGIDMKLIDSLDVISTDRLRPDLTILLDIDVETGLMRNRHINKQDRLELEDVRFHELVRKGFLSLAAGEPDRFRIVASSAGIEEVHRKIAALADDFIQRSGR
ncbi:MAG: dTMP kinase [Nitrospiraceae bacterium]|nr:dTMP kinase [Nitrospiraceae bacterium]